MKTSFLSIPCPLSLSCTSDVRDGLKPVHRRILYAMSEAGVHDRPHKKSAWAVGEVMGKVPLTVTRYSLTPWSYVSDFSMRLPLSSAGFGSYRRRSTSSNAFGRLTKCYGMRLAELSKNTVDLQSNYDESLTEPAVLLRFQIFG